MKALCRWNILMALALVVVCGACRTLRFRKAKKEPTVDESTLLSPIRTKHRYVTPSDLPQVQLRVALIDTAWGPRRTTYTSSVGMFRPHDGLYRAETDVQSVKSIPDLVTALDRHVDRMPVGIIVTANGRVPGAAGIEPPAAFGAFVSALQQALDKEGIQFTFVVPDELHVIK